VIHSARWDTTTTSPAAGRMSAQGKRRAIIPSIAKDVERLDRLPAHPDLDLAQLDPKIRLDEEAVRRLPFTQRIARAWSAPRSSSIIIVMPLNFQRFRSRPRGGAAEQALLASQVKDPETRHKLTPDYGMAQAGPRLEQLHVDVQTATTSSCSPTGSTR